MASREDDLLAGNRVLAQRIAHLRESAQRSWESLEHYVGTRTEEKPCGFCGSWGEHDNDSCELVAVVTSLELDFGCGEHWRGETIPEEPPSETPKTGWGSLSDDDKTEWLAMAAEMKDPATRSCGCGYPKTGCLRVVLRNGPPYPARPCEPGATS